MIQLTKGTNVLDINLSDYSGAGQDVVQNGSFDDIGSDLILNGDFAEIGSDLVTNGDFSDVPLGSELITNGDFAVSGTLSFTSYSLGWRAGDIGLSISDGALNLVNDGSGFVGRAYATNGVDSIYVLEVGKTYSLTYEVTENIDAATLYYYAGSFVSISKDVGVHTVEFTASLDYFILRNGSSNTTIKIDNVSVKEVINLVSNPNFTDTGSELLTGFSNGAIYPFTTFVTSGNDISSAIVSSNYAAAVSNSIALTIGESYLVTFTYTKNSGDDLKVKFSDATGAGVSYSNAEIITESGTYSKYFTITTTTTGYLQMGTSGSGSLDISLTDVSVKELGADWIELSTDPDSVSFGENGLTIVQSSDGGTDNRAYQVNVTEADKSYKVTYTIQDAQYTASNRVQYYNGAGYVNYPEQGVGTHEFYYTREGANNHWFFNLKTTTTSATDFVTISSISVQELGEGWTVGDKWSLSDEGARLVSSTSDASGLSQSNVFEIGKSYKVTLDAVVNSGIAKLEKSGGGIQFRIDETKTYVEYFVATKTDIYFNRVSTISDIYINNITVQEVGQDWTVTNSTSTQYVEFFGGVGGARIVVADAATSPILTLGVSALTLLAGKSYKLVVDVTVVSGSVKYDVTGTTILFDTTEVKTAYFSPVSDVGLSFYRASSNVDVTFNSVIVQELDTNNRWVTFADPDSKSVMKLGQVDLEIDASDNNCGVYQTGLIKPNKLYIITINMKATAALNVEIAASLGTSVSAVIGTTALTTSYVEYSFEYVTPFAVDHDLLIHRFFGAGANETISIDYVSMNGVDESKWINDPTWDPFATSLVYVPTLTDESTNNSKQFTLDTSITDGGWDGRSLHGQVTINEYPTEVPALGIINLEQPDFLEGFYQFEIRGYLGTFYRILGKGMAHLERASTEDGYNRFEAYNDSVTYKAYEE